MRHSIFLRISLFFLFTLTAMGIGFYFLHQKLAQDHTKQLELEAGKLLLVLRKSIVLDQHERRSFLQEQGYSVAEPHPDLIHTLSNALPCIPENYPEAIKDSLKEGRIQILKDENHLYIYLSKATPPLLVIKTDAAKQSLWPAGVFTILTLSLLLLYWLIIRTIFPLKTLINSINHYANSGLYTPIKSGKKDEISLVSRALDSAMHKNQTLLEARRLFLRNIMHELKTPITVGKLAIPFLKNSEEKSILDRAFSRMEHLIAELVKVEQITSGALAPHLQECNSIKLIKKAESLLFLTDEKVDLQLSETAIYADCEVLVTVFKNLIDNGIKYSTDGKITIVQHERTFLFFNKADPWPSGCTLQTLSEPFFHHHENEQSFGLGLYIVKSILDAHNFAFNHRYEEGFHCFEVMCLNPLLPLD